MSVSGLVTRLSASVVSSAAGTGRSCVTVGLADRDARHLELRPARAARSAACSPSSRYTSEPDRPAAQQDDAQRRKLTPRHGGRSPPPALRTARASGIDLAY